MAETIATRRRRRKKSSPILPKILAVARPVVKWGLMPAVLWMGMRTEPSPGLIDVLYPF